KIAKKETRAITINKTTKSSPLSIPPGEYLFLESYCTALDNCKRVFLNVIYKGEVESLRGKILTTIGYGWENVEYYEKDWKSIIEDGLITAEQMKGPTLEVGQYQSKYASTLLKFAKKYLLTDDKYLERLEKHSKMVDQKLQ
ncbi:MAG: hypothetical protein ACC656_15360, partial [Candidatus Heimdallarchaeota archaeon]